MSDYCTCCATNAEHIRQHYDPSALTKPDANPAHVLEDFRSWNEPGDDPCPLTLRDVQDYLDSLRQEKDREILSEIEAVLRLGGDDQDWDAPEWETARKLTEGYSWEFTSWSQAASLLERRKLERAK